LAQAHVQTEDCIKRLTSERDATKRQIRKDYERVGALAAKTIPGDPRLAEAQEHIREAELRVSEIDGELAVLCGMIIDEAEVIEALSEFDQLWESLTPREQMRVIELLIERITYDGAAGKLSIAYRPTGIRTLANELDSMKVEDAA